MKQIIGLLFLFILLDNLQGDMGYFLLDDFTGSMSTLEQPWEGFTDQVMGGVSEISVSRLNLEDEVFIRMSGAVSLDNNGGFIQIRQKLAEPLQVFDGSEYKGIRLKVRGKSRGYYVFIRTTATIFPWKFYKAEFSVQDHWSVVEIPWTSFQEGDYGRLRTFRPEKIKSLALVAYGREFQAQLDISEIGFYK